MKFSELRNAETRSSELPSILSLMPLWPPFPPHRLLSISFPLFFMPFPNDTCVLPWFGRLLFVQVLSHFPPPQSVLTFFFFKFLVCLFPHERVHVSHFRCTVFKFRLLLPPGSMLVCTLRLAPPQNHLPLCSSAGAHDTIICRMIPSPRMEKVVGKHPPKPFPMTPSTPPSNVFSFCYAKFHSLFSSPLRAILSSPVGPRRLLGSCVPPLSLVVLLLPSSYGVLTSRLIM